uniref:Uncharacterized protein n=1 Tax=Anguilla anguilla TaxID=7936 RepID=A0A0E9RLX8_ANGAN
MHLQSTFSAPYSKCILSFRLYLFYYAFALDTLVVVCNNNPCPIVLGDNLSVSICPKMCYVVM